MILSETLHGVFQEQYTVELGNSLFYESLQRQAENLAWDGFSKFFEKASKEEHGHADGFAGFLTDRNRVATIGNIPAPTGYGDKPLDWILASLEAEKENTRRIYRLYEQCRQEGDWDACVFLEPYLAEQRTSERELTDLEIQLERAGSLAGVMLIDEALNGG